jgi:hypothetical protein
MAQMSITLPKALRERMVLVKKKVNWSEEARRCFEYKLSELGVLDADFDLDDVAERLIRSRESARLQRNEELSIGYNWARTQASYDDLVALADFWKKNLNEQGEFAYIYESSHQDLSNDLGIAAGYIDEPWLFWEKVLGKDSPLLINVNFETYEEEDERRDMNFTPNFLVGVMKLYEQVKDKIKD